MREFEAIVKVVLRTLSVSLSLSLAFSFYARISCSDGMRYVQKTNRVFTREKREKHSCNRITEMWTFVNSLFPPKSSTILKANGKLRNCANKLKINFNTNRMKSDWECKPPENSNFNRKIRTNFSFFLYIFSLNLRIGWKFQFKFPICLDSQQTYRN